MASVVITIKTGNAAFHDADPLDVAYPREIARILETIIGRLDGDEDIDGMILRDINGNVVGKVEVLE